MSKEQAFQEYLQHAFFAAVWVVAYEIYPAIIIGVGAAICRTALYKQTKPLSAFIRATVIGTIVAILVYKTMYKIENYEHYVAVTTFIFAFLADYILGGIVKVGKSFEKNPVGYVANIVAAYNRITGRKR